jgi:hypothetical protein
MTEPFDKTKENNQSVWVCVFCVTLGLIVVVPRQEHQLELVAVFHSSGSCTANHITVSGVGLHSTTNLG